MKSSTYRVVLSSIYNLSSLQIILLHYFVLPLISLVMFLLIAFDSHQNYSRILLGTIITSGIATSMGIVNASSVYDQNIGIYDDILSIRPRFSKYWLPKLIIAGVVSAIEVLILAGVGLIVLKQYQTLERLIIFLPLIILLGLVFAFFATIWGIKHSNPYWLSNIISAGLVLVSGVIIPVDQYPNWLKWLAILFPVSDLLDVISSPNFLSSSLLFCIAKSLIWTLFCFISIKLLNRKFLSQDK